MGHPVVPKSRRVAEVHHFGHFANTLAKSTEYRILVAGKHDLNYHRVFTSLDPVQTQTKLTELAAGDQWEIIKLECVETLDHNFADHP